MPAAKPHGISIRLRFEPFPNEPLIGRIADCLIGAVFGDVLAVAAGTEIHAAKIPVVKQKGFPFADLVLLPHGAYRPQKRCSTFRFPQTEGRPQNNRHQTAHFLPPSCCRSPSKIGTA